MTLFRKHTANCGEENKKRKNSARYSGWLILLLIFLTSTTISCGQAPGNQSDVEWLIDVLKLKEGSIVADIGAGDGNQTVAIARYIGTNGQIYSTELEAASVEELKDGIANSGLDNITVIEGHPNQTNLPEECCDAIYLRNVYHHLKNPEAFNASLLKTLKPGGRLAIIDFEPRGSEAEPSGRASGSQHGVTAQTVVKELRQVGFGLISSEQASGRDIYVVVKKTSTAKDK